jgi:hypothetical protein
MVKVQICKNIRINCKFLKIMNSTNNSVTSEKCINYISGFYGTVLVKIKKMVGKIG